MSIIKKGISLPNHVLKAALKEANVMHGGSLSAYINYLICNDIPEEVKNELIEEKKPVRISGTFEAAYTGKCIYCGNELVGEEGCRARFNNGDEGWAHISCCRKEE